MNDEIDERGIHQRLSEWVIHQHHSWWLHSIILNRSWLLELGGSTRHATRWCSMKLGTEHCEQRTSTLLLFKCAVSGKQDEMTSCWAVATNAAILNLNGRWKTPSPDAGLLTLLRFRLLSHWAWVFFSERHTDITCPLPARLLGLGGHVRVGRKPCRCWIFTNVKGCSLN